MNWIFLNKSETSEIYETAQKYVLSRIVQQGIFDLIFLCLIFSSALFFRVSLGIVGLLLGLWSLFHYAEHDWGRFAVFLVTGIVVALIGIFARTNLIFDYGGSINQSVQFNALKEGVNPLDSFFQYYGWLAILGLAGELLIAIYIYYSNIPKNLTITVDEDDTPKDLWSLFLVERSWSKFLLLTVFLAVASIHEEIIYRYIIMNILAEMTIGDFSLPLVAVIVISSLIFGLMHYSVGGWFHVLSSALAGIIFAVSFLNGGLLSSWVLHLFWNALVMVQILTSILLKQRFNEGDR